MEKHFGLQEDDRKELLDYVLEKQLVCSGESVSANNREFDFQWRHTGVDIIAVVLRFEGQAGLSQCTSSF